MPHSHHSDVWEPSAPLNNLRVRAALLRDVRAFFDSRGVLEVETPILCRGAVGHAEIDLFATRYRSASANEVLFLRSSPEAHLKRLLAAGYGSVYQLAKAFRHEPADPLHNPEFTILEYYRAGWVLTQLMDEVDQFMQQVIGLRPCRRVSYAAVFHAHTGLDPFFASTEALWSRAQAMPDFTGIDAAGKFSARERLISALMDSAVQPLLGAEEPVLVYDFPASHGCLSRVRPGDPPVAERFEVFFKGMELANGCQELTDPRANAREAAAERDERRARGRQDVPGDARFLAATDAGLPDCSGVAMGMDRLAMIVAGAQGIGEVLTFPFDRA